MVNARAAKMSHAHVERAAHTHTPAYYILYELERFTNERATSVKHRLITIFVTTKWQYFVCQDVPGTRSDEGGGGVVEVDKENVGNRR